MHASGCQMGEKLKHITFKGLHAGNEIPPQLDRIYDHKVGESKTKQHIKQRIVGIITTMKTEHKIINP
jgi:hypothetical protein